MAYTTINKHTDYFNTKLYTGNNSTNAITGVGHQPDMVWIKRRDNTADHQLYDAVRGVQKAIFPSTTGTEGTEGGTRGLNAFNSDGFTLGAEVSDIAGSCNVNGGTYASWNWKGNGAGSSNTDGSITSTVSANTTAGFSIVKWTGTGANATVGHGLGAVPKMIIVKNTTGSGWSWYVYHVSTGATKNIYLNNTDTPVTDSTRWQDTTPTSSVFYLGSNGGVNGSGNTMIAYCFAEKTGYSKFGYWTGNASTNGPFTYTGFRPEFLMWKRTDATNDWFIVDGKRDNGNETDAGLFPSTNGAESIGNGYNGVDFLSNGFKVRQANSGCNASGGTYIWMVFGQSLVGSNNVPCIAR